VLDEEGRQVNLLACSTLPPRASHRHRPRPVAPAECLQARQRALGHPSPRCTEGSPGRPQPGDTQPRPPTTRHRPPGGGQIPALGTPVTPAFMSGPATTAPAMQGGSWPAPGGLSTAPSWPGGP
jgi:hypothetical protein